MTAERNDDSHRLFGVDDVGDIFECQRFEVEPVARVVVRRNGLRVAVDHDGLEPSVGKREARMDTAIIELDALPDAIGARAKDHDLWPIRWTHLAVVFPGRIVIRGFRCEFGTAGVDRLERRLDALSFTRCTDVGLRRRPQIGELTIGEPELFDPLPLTSGRVGHRRSFDGLALFGDPQHLIEEPWIDLG